MTLTLADKFQKGAALLAVLIAAPLHAQDPGSLEATCRTAAAQATTARNVDTLRNAIAQLTVCRNAPETLAVLWRQPPEDSITLRTLSGVSGNAWDVRLLNTLSLIAEDASQHQRIRLAAISALVSICEDGKSMILLNAPTATGYRLRPQLVRWTEHVRSEFVQPSSAAQRKGIMDLLSRLAVSDQDATVQGVAADLVKLLDP